MAVDLLELGTSPGTAPPRPVSLRPPLTRQRLTMRLVIAAFVVATAWAWWYVDMSLTRIWSGLGDMKNLLDRMLPPRFDDLDHTISLAFQTLWMAVIGTAIAIALSFPLAFGAARNTTPHPAVMAMCRAVIVLARAIPDLLFAAIFVRALKIGPLPGILALGLHSIGMIGKLFADSIEQTPTLPREAVASVGARKWQTIWTTVIPQAMPGFIATALYRLDINLRSASVLGLVGAGGIGVWLKQMTGSLQWNKALGIVIVVFAFITVMELLSALVRATLLGGERTMVGRKAPRFSLGARIARTIVQRGESSGGVRPFNRTTVRPPLSGERAAKLLYGGVFAGLLVLAFYFVRLNPWTVITKLPDIWEVGTRMFPLDFTSARDSIITGLTQSIAIALMATFFGFLFALPLGLLAARNVTVNRFVYAFARLTVTLVRGTPELIVCVIFVAAMGLGPIPGIFALVVGTTGFFSKLIADAVEEVDPVPREGVFATGATRLQETTTSVIPQAMPSIVGNLLYVLDINLRTSAILGIVGGGGIGTLLMNSIKVLKWQTTGAILLSIFVIVYGIELLASWIRKQIL